MSRTAKTAIASFSLFIIALALTGCTPDPVADDTACITGSNWALDVNDSASQIGEYLSSNGMDVISSEGVGSHFVTFTADGLVSSDIDVSMTIAARMSSGMTLTLVQTQSGLGGGEWSWQGDSGVIAFDNWDNGNFQVQTQTFINDIATPNSVTIPGDSLGGTTMEVLACTPELLSTHATGNPFTQTWRPAG